MSIPNEGEYLCCQLMCYMSPKKHKICSKFIFTNITNHCTADVQEQNLGKKMTLLTLKTTLRLKHVELEYHIDIIDIISDIKGQISEICDPSVLEKVAISAIQRMKKYVLLCRDFVMFYNNILYQPFL